MNRKYVRGYTFAFVLMLVFLFSPMMGTTFGEKPDRPRGKRFQTWDLTIRIGIGNEDNVTLAGSIYEDQDGYYLFAEDVPCSGGLWSFPEPRGKSDNGKYVSAQFSLFRWYNETTGEWIGDECGTYQLPADLDQFPLDDYEIYEVDIGHQVNPMGQDFWWFRLIWVLEQPDPNEWEFYCLWAWTDKNGDPEVMPPEANVLLVPFNGAECIFFSDWTDEDPPDGVPDNLDWTETLSFTIKITRSPHEA